MSHSRILIAIPAYNEELVISDVIKDLKKKIKSAKLKADICIVNDASNDATPVLASKLGVIVISHILNSGAGSATATGIAYAKKYKYDILATMDADGQHTAQDIVNGIERILGSDIDLLIGSRLIDSSGMSALKIFGNKVLTFVTYLLFGIGVTDSQSGMRIFSKQAINTLQWKSAGYEFCSEMLWRAKQTHLRIGEYPIQAIYTDYSIAKGQNNWNAFNILKSLVKQRVAEIFQ